MPRQSVPSYRLHKPSGQARTIIHGRHIYLGKYNSPESRKKYARLLAELSQPSSTADDSGAGTSLMLVSELLVKYLEYAEDYYTAEDKGNKEFPCMIAAVKPVNQLYGNSLASEYGPLKLKATRQHLIDQDLCRTEINKRIGRIKRVFKWAVSEELIPPSVYEGLRTVSGLRHGRSKARESKPVTPVSEDQVELTLPYVSPQVSAMIRLQLLTGMRPGEVLCMMPRDIDHSGDIWIYEPEKHKNRWRGHRRLIPLGPQAQELIAPFLDRPVSEYLFSPAEAEAWRNEQRALNRNRKTALSPYEIKKRADRHEKSKRRKPKRPKGNCYCPDSYRRAVTYGIKKSNRERIKDDSEACAVSSWTPYQLRHTFATKMRRLHGVEAAQLGLGHARTNIVDIYAEKNLSLLIELAKTGG